MRFVAAILVWQLLLFTIPCDVLLVYCKFSSGVVVLSLDARHPTMTGSPSLSRIYDIFVFKKENLIRFAM